MPSTDGRRLSGKTALITGGSRGIGLAIARAYLDEGANVCVVARDPNALGQARTELALAGGQVLTFAGDVTDRGACFAAVDYVIEGLGGLDIMVNNAASYVRRPFLDYTAEEFEAVMGVSAHGAFHFMQAAGARMVAQGHGKIVNLASTAGKWASSGQAAYNAAKHAVVGLTRCAAVEFAVHGVSVNAICPGLVRTDMARHFAQDEAERKGICEAEALEAMLARVSMGRLLEPEEVAQLAVFLASAASDGMTGQSLVIDGGMLFV